MEEEESWGRNLESSAGIWISGRHLEASGRHLGGTWEASGGTWEAPGGSPRPPGLKGRLGVKIMQTHSVCLSKVAQPTILAESGEGDPHDLRSLHTKVGGHRGQQSRHEIPNTEDTPPEPLQQRQFGEKRRRLI